jgi:hypothetical protein
MKTASDGVPISAYSFDRRWPDDVYWQIANVSTWPAPRFDDNEAVAGIGAPTESRAMGIWGSSAAVQRAVLIGFPPSSPRVEIDALGVEQGIFYTPRDAQAEGIRTVDLHGFSQHRAECIVRDVMGHLDSWVRTVHFITGKGLHSEDGVPKLKPFVLGMFRDNRGGFQAREFPGNTGIVEVFQ